MKKIMFNDRYYLTELTLSGKKTRTTRMPASLRCLDDAARLGYNRFEILKNKLLCYKGDSFIKKTLPYQIGEVVAVAQAYKDALSAERCCGSDYQCDGVWYSTKQAGYRNKMFVKAELMPSRIRFNDMKIERMQDISDEDCLKEGIEKREQICEGETRIVYAVPGDDQVFAKPKQAYRHLIQKMYGGAAWQLNPFVLALYYEHISDKKQQ